MGGRNDGTTTARLRKRDVRRDLLAVRAALADDEVVGAAAALQRHALGLPELANLAPGATVAGYVSVGHEPGTAGLLAALRDRGVRVLLPVLRPDFDLDWAEFEGAGRLVESAHAGRSRLLEPSGPRLGRAAIAQASVVLLPGVAVDRRGVRIGRGGGSFDRVLARLAAANARPALVALVYGHEVVDLLPSEPHDRSVHVAVTPEGVHRFGSGDAGPAAPAEGAGPRDASAGEPNDASNGGPNEESNGGPNRGPDEEPRDAS